MLLHQNILDVVAEKGVALVDNLDFINWASSHGGLEEQDGSIPVSFPLFEYVRAKFLSEYGADPIQTIDQLG